MKERTDHLNAEHTDLTEVKVRLDVTIIREDIKIGLDQTMHTEDDLGMDKTIEVGQEMILIIKVAMGIIQEVVRGMEDQIIIIEGETLEVKTMKEIGVGHMKDRRETEGAVEALVTVDQG